MLIWIPARVGCYWSADDFHIATRVTVENGKTIMTWPKSGYLLSRNREEIGMFKTLKAAQRAAIAVIRAERKAERDFHKAFTPNKHGEYA